MRTALTEVYDPELNISMVELGLIYGIEVEGAQQDEVTVTMTLTSPMCPVGPMFKQAVEEKVKAVPGVNKTRVEITFSPPWDPRTMASEEAKMELGIW
ncbi:MAG TPA: iron-sulfur cluster assembly protein [Candidatus Dormibacteraeota bacterium]|nr:iron-sulfur cluster assembly protein [Candidatus Dormibacteraeota bacterium]